MVWGRVVWFLPPLPMDPRPSSKGRAFLTFASWVLRLGSPFSVEGRRAVRTHSRATSPHQVTLNGVLIPQRCWLHRQGPQGALFTVGPETGPSAGP